MTTVDTYPPPAPAAAVVTPWQHRLVAAVAMSVPAALLGIASRLGADPRGLGTHQQLGLPACGFYAMTGFPCPACGMTTAFTYAAHGQLLDAAIAQPAGALLAVFSACVVIIGAYALVYGRSLGPAFRPLGRFGVVATFGGVILAAWAFKILMVLHGVTR